MYEAEERGVQQGKFVIAMKLYDQGWKIEDISGIVDVSAEVLKEKIVKKMKR